MDIRDRSMLNFFETEKFRKLWKNFTVFVFTAIAVGLYFCICSPYKTSLDLINQNKYEKAIKITTFWSKIIPADSRWYSLRGYAKFYSGDFNGAIADYDKAYKLRNDEFKSMNFDNKIYIKYFLKDYKSALADFDKEIKNTQNEERDSMLWDKAQFLFNIEKYNDALSIYNDLIKKSTTDQIYLMESRLYYERALVHQKLGMIKEANEDLKNAKNLDLDIEYQNTIPKPVFLLEKI